MLEFYYWQLSMVGIPYSTGVSEVCFGGAKYPTIGNFIRGPVYSEGYDDFLNNWDFFSRDTKLHYNTIWYDTIRYNTIRYDTIQYDTIRYDMIRHDSIPFHIIRFDTIRYDTIRNDSICYDTIRYDNYLKLNCLFYINESYSNII